MTRDTAQKWITSTWLILIGCILFIMIRQTYGGKYGPDYGKVWGWFAQNVIPTTSLIITVVFTFKQRNENASIINRFYFFWAEIFSIAYLTIIFSLFALPDYNETQTIWDILQESTAYLAIFQGILGSILGYIFFKNNDS